MKRVINDAPGHAPSRGILDEVVFQVQGANEQPALAVVQLHQRRIGQVELAFQQGAPAAAVGLLDGIFHAVPENQARAPLSEHGFSDPARALLNLRHIGGEAEGRIGRLEDWMGGGKNSWTQTIGVMSSNGYAASSSAFYASILPLFRAFRPLRRPLWERCVRLRR